MNIEKAARKEAGKAGEIALKDQKKEELKSLQHETQERLLLRQRDINKAFGKMYFAIYSVDLTTGYYLEVSTLDIFREHIPPRDKNELLFQMVVQYYVSEGYQEGMREFLDMTTLQERLSVQNAVSHEFHGTTQGWCRASFVAESRAEDGQILRFLYVTQEINQEKRLELEKQQALKAACEAANLANRAKSDFLSKMSHDIRTPMNAIIGMTAIAAAHPDDPERVKDCLSKIAVSGRHLLGLINEVLDMSKIESGTVSLNAEEFSIRSLTDHLVDIIRPLTEGRHHTLEFRRKGIVHDRVIGDSVRLQQALVNIGSNAVKYTPEGGKIGILAEELPSRRSQFGKFRFTCRDNGIGMSPEFVRQIFEPFSREKDSRVNRIQGTGLGMTITNSIISMMDGNIRVESEPGKGSVFTVTVYLRLPEDISEEAASEKRDSENGIVSLSDLKQLQFPGRRVLLAEDNELNREIADEFLTLTGVTVDQVSDGREAVKRFREVPAGYYDMIFLDIQMPEMNGNEAARAIRCLEREDAGNVPIIAMTANAFAEDVEEALQSGMNGHLAKPLDMERLAAVLQKWLQ